MDMLNRRDFLSRTALAVGASLTARSRLMAVEAQTRPAATQPAHRPYKPNDQIVLGKTGIKTSRLSIGTGTRGGSEQRSAGTEAMIKLFRSALD